MYFPIFEFFKFHSKVDIKKYGFNFIKKDIEFYSSIIGAIFARTFTSIVSFPLELSKIKE